MSQSSGRYLESTHAGEGKGVRRGSEPLSGCVMRAFPKQHGNYSRRGDAVIRSAQTDGLSFAASGVSGGWRDSVKAVCGRGVPVGE
jgi:hypothetical protein